MTHGIVMWDEKDKLKMINEYGYKVLERGGVFVKPGVDYKEYIIMQKKNNFHKFNNKREIEEYYDVALKYRKILKGVTTIERPRCSDDSIRVWTMEHHSIHDHIHPLAIPAQWRTLLVYRKCIENKKRSKSD